MITEPGIVPDLPNAAYHAETDWLSSSMLKAKLPERYKTGGSRDALDFGTAFHTLVLEPDAADTIAWYDATLTFNSKAGAVFRVEADEAGKTPVHINDRNRLEAMVEAVWSHPTAAQLLGTEGPVEESAFAVDDNGLHHKARFDKRIPGALVDLKSTTAKPGAESLARTVIDYGYDLSAAHYLAVAALLGLDADAFAFVFVSKEAPHHVTVADLDETFLARGRVLRALAIERSTLTTADAYEGATGFLTLNAPRWAELGDTA